MVKVIVIVCRVLICIYIYGRFSAEHNAGGVEGTTEHAGKPLYRKDIFYSGSTLHLAPTQSQLVHSAPTDGEGDDPDTTQAVFNSDKVVICHCLPVSVSTRNKVCHMSHRIMYQRT